MQMTGELRQWHDITLDFQGPAVTETDPSTFREYRLDVTFTHSVSGRELTVPGYFAADGDAADTGAAAGAVWRVHFNPPETGDWIWQASFRTGRDVAVSLEPEAGMPVEPAPGGEAIDGAGGSFAVEASNKDGADLRARGMLQHDGDGYLGFAGDGSTFLKSGVGSPENFLAYDGFDNTPGSHSYDAHVADYRPGDPSWGDGEGAGIIGAVNYVAEHDVNSAYMMLMNVGGDGRDVWPWAASNLDSIKKNAGNTIDLTAEAWTFDVSKLAQWEIVFAHMQAKGINLHLFLQETENDQLLNDGDLGLERKLFIREMLARFGHHNGVIFNLGEENTNTTAQITDHSAYLQALDAYGHPVTLHTYPGQHSKYENYAGTETLDALSFQTSGDTQVPDLDRYLGGAEAAGRPVAAFLDEPGNASVGMAAEGDSGWEVNHANLRETLWKFYAEGGSGAEWYFGYQTAGGDGGDLRMEDFALRESAYGWAAAARRFFEGLPLSEMVDGDALTSGTNGADEVLAKPGEVYALYLPDGGAPTLDLSGEAGTYAVAWYDTTSGETYAGSVATVDGGAAVSLGSAPYAANGEWAVLVERDGTVPQPQPEPEPEPEPQPEPEPEPQPGELFVFQLVDAGDDRIIDGDLSDGVQGLTAEDLAGPLAVAATAATPSAVSGAVDLVLTGPGGTVTKTENVTPYAIFGDTSGDYAGEVLAEGAYTLSATNDGTTETVDFDLTAQAAVELTLSANPQSLSENGGTATATVSRSGSTTGALLVSISTSDAGEAMAPAEITIPAGAASATFEVSGVDDGEVDGAQSVTLSATAPAATTATTTVQVTDDDVAPPPNLAPVLETTTFSLREDTSFYDFSIAANDLGYDPEGEDLFFDSVSQPANGEATIYGSGYLLAYQPDADFAGSDTVAVTVSDRTAQGTEQTAATITFVVEPVNDAPVAGDDGPIPLAAGDVRTFGDELLGNDGDVDGDELTIVDVMTERPADFAELELDADGRVRVALSAEAAGEARFTYTVADPSGAEASAEVKLAVTTPDAEAPILAYNLGSSAPYTAGDGTVFAADDLGVGRTYTKAGAIAATDEDTLYTTEAYGPGGLAYEFVVPDGDYRVTLHFAEIWPPAETPGTRVFDVEIEGALVEDDLDIAAKVGGRTAYVSEHAVSVADGMLDIDLIKGLQNPKLSALEISRIGPAPANAPPTVVDDSFSFDLVGDAYVDPETGVAEVGLTKFDLFANDADDDFDGDGYQDLQLEVVDAPTHGELQLAGEASVITYLFDPAAHPGSDSFRYRAVDEEGASSEVATVTLAFDGLPTPAARLAQLALVDAGDDVVLFDLGPSVIVDAAPLAGRDLTVAAWVDEAVEPVASARLFLDDRATRVENVEPYALFGDTTGDFRGGLALNEGDVLEVGADFYGAPAATGEQLGSVASTIAVQTAVLNRGRDGAPDLFALDETTMGTAEIRGFEELDTLALFGGTFASVDEVIDAAAVQAGDTRLDVGDGNSLTLVNFATLSADDIAIF